MPKRDLDRITGLRQEPSTSAPTHSHTRTRRIADVTAAIQTKVNPRSGPPLGHERD